MDNQKTGSFKLPLEGRHRGDILYRGFSLSFSSKNSNIAGLQKSDSVPYVRTASAPGISLGAASASSTYKGFLDIRRQRVMGVSWTRVWAIVSPGELHLVQNVPTQRQAYKLADFRLVPDVAKMNNVFMLGHKDEIETGKKGDMVNSLVFRAPNADEKSAWLRAVTRAMESRARQDTLTAAATANDSPAATAQAAQQPRRNSLPSNFRQSAALEIVREAGDEPTGTDDADENGGRPHD